MLSKVILVIFLFISRIYCQSPQGSQCPSITNPVYGTIWKLGDKGVINWTPGGVNLKVNIKLRKGIAAAMQEVTTIINNIDQNAKTFTWTIPKNLPLGSDYVIEIGSAPNLCYSHYFSIDNNNIESINY